MGRFVTPQGVEIEMGDEAARVVGYQPAKATSKGKAAAEKPACRAKSDEK